MEPGSFKRGPDGWTIEVHGHKCTAPDLIGFCYLDVLIRHAGRDVKNNDVIRWGRGPPPPSRPMMTMEIALILSHWHPTSALRLTIPANSPRNDH